MRLPKWLQRNQDGDANRFADLPQFKQVWERKPLPSPGAMNYAFETLSLPPFSPIDGAISNRGQLSLFQYGQLYQYQAVNTVGVPTVSGQVIMQPLFDPASGYSGPEAVALDPLVAMNIPIGFPSDVPMNAASIVAKR